MNEKEKKYVEKTMSNYQEKKETKLEELRELDKKVMRGPTCFASVFGAIGALILGFGMCIAMEVILPGLMWLGIVIGCIGIIMVCINYSIYKKMVQKNKEKYAEQIVQLSNDLLNQ